MRNKILPCLFVVFALFVVSLMGGREVQAGSKDMVSSKRLKFEDDSVESMRDVFARKEAEEEEYRKKMLSNGDKTIELLTQVRDLLRTLNEKDHGGGIRGR
jgi:hypothetical protein